MNWVPGKSDCGQVRYATASHAGKALSLSSAVVNGEKRYLFWVDKSVLKVGQKQEVLDFAKEWERGQDSDQRA